jgi:hypothetical protein
VRKETSQPRIFGPVGDELKSLLRTNTLADVYGPGVVVSGRPQFEETHVSALYRDTQDVLSAPPIAVAGTVPVICSAGSTDPALLNIFAAQGMPVGTDLRTYRSEAEFNDCITNAVSNRELVAAEYPQPTYLLPNNSALNSAELVSFLNNKGKLQQIVSPEFCPTRQIGTYPELAPLLTENSSWVIKAATDRANGGGYDVYIHQAGMPIVEPEFVPGTELLVFEEHLQLVTNWSVQQYIDPFGNAVLFGQTEQRIGPDGAFLGNRFGDITPLDPRFVKECRAIATRAANMGYRGFCAIDGALTEDGRIVIFDLNFRISSPSCPLFFLQTSRPELLAEAAVETARWTSEQPLAEVLSQLDKHIEAGELLLLSGHDSRHTDSLPHRTIILVAVIGNDRHHVAALRTQLERTI